MTEFSGDRHGWNSFEGYLNSHYGHLRVFEYFVEDDGLEIEWVNSSRLRIAGRIRCANGLFIDVFKLLEVNGRGQVRTFRYSYHAGVEGNVDRPIFRYDNSHTYVRESHGDEHHKHHFDCTSWKKIDPPEWIGRDQWPTLDQVIEELQSWWEETGKFLQLDSETPAAPPE